jgi:hypothetical protein
MAQSLTPVDGGLHSLHDGRAVVAAAAARTWRCSTRLDAAGFIGSEAAKGTYIDARNRRIMEDNRRQIAEAERSQREFEAKGRRG